MFVLLFLAAAAGGALNSVAGGGSFICLPALMFAGISPVAANATTTMAMWPGSISSAWAYRRDIGAFDRPLMLLSAVSLVGGLLGGYLLVRTSDTSFLRLLPWLMLVSAVTFTFAGRLTSRLRGDEDGRPIRHRPVPFWALAVQLVIAAYGGYFGGGMGIMMLAVFSVAGLTDIHEMNGLKAVLAVFINSAPLGEFAAHGALVWAPGLVMVVGAIVGGYFGASFARRRPQAGVRAFVIVVGWAMTIYFFVGR